MDPNIKKNIKLDIGEMTPRNIDLVKKETGIDLSGYKRVIDNYSIRHIINEHGNPKTESARGQIAIGEDDIFKIQQIISTPDKIYYAGKTKIGRDAVGYLKKIGNEIYYLEEVRSGKKEVVPVTMYKRASAPDAPLLPESPA